MSKLKMVLRLPVMRLAGERGAKASANADVVNSFFVESMSVCLVSVPVAFSLESTSNGLASRSVLVSDVTLGAQRLLEVGGVLARDLSHHVDVQRPAICGNRVSVQVVRLDDDEEESLVLSLFGWRHL